MEFRCSIGGFRSLAWSIFSRTVFFVNWTKIYTVQNSGSGHPSRYRFALITVAFFRLAVKPLVRKLPNFQASEKAVAADRNAKKFQSKLTGTSRLLDTLQTAMDSTNFLSADEKSRITDTAAKLKNIFDSFDILEMTKAADEIEDTVSQMDSFLLDYEVNFTALTWELNIVYLVKIDQQEHLIFSRMVFGSFKNKFM